MAKKTYDFETSITGVSNSFLMRSCLSLPEYRNYTYIMECKIRMGEPVRAERYVKFGQVKTSFKAPAQIIYDTVYLVKPEIFTTVKEALNGGDPALNQAIGRSLRNLCEYKGLKTPKKQNSNLWPKSFIKQVATTKLEEMLASVNSL